MHEFRKVWKRLPKQLEKHFRLDPKQKLWAPQLEHKFDQKEVLQFDIYTVPSIWGSIYWEAFHGIIFYQPRKCVLRASPTPSSELEKLHDAWAQPTFWSRHLLALARDSMEVDLMLRLSDSIASGTSLQLPNHLYPELIRPLEPSMATDLVLQGPDASLLLHIFEYLPLRDKSSVAQTCSVWRDVAKIARFSNRRVPQDELGTVGRWHQLQSQYSRKMFEKLLRNERALEEYTLKFRSLPAETKNPKLRESVQFKRKNVCCFGASALKGKRAYRREPHEQCKSNRRKNSNM